MFCQAANCKRIRIRIRIRASPSVRTRVRRSAAKIGENMEAAAAADAAVVVVVKWQTFARTSRGKRPGWSVCLCVHNKHHMRSTPRGGVVEE